MSKKNLCIFGAGGAAKDALAIAASLGLLDEIDCFLETDNLWVDREVLGIRVKPISAFNFTLQKIVIAIGDPLARQAIVKSLPEVTQYYSLIHPNSVLSPWVKIGEGSIIGAGCILTSDISIGCHAYINTNTSIAHDCRIGDFFTSSPGVNLSGNCHIGNRVFLGINSSIREKTHIADDVFVGMGSVVVTDLSEPGTYFGNPARITKMNSY